MPPVLRRTQSTPASRSSPYPPSSSMRHQTRAQTTIRERQVLRDLEWWRVVAGQLDDDDAPSPITAATDGVGPASQDTITPDNRHEPDVLAVEDVENISLDGFGTNTFIDPSSPTIGGDAPGSLPLLDSSPPTSRRTPRSSPSNTPPRTYRNRRSLSFTFPWLDSSPSTPARDTSLSPLSAADRTSALQHDWDTFNTSFASGASIRALR